MVHSRQQGLSPSQIIIIGFAAVIALGTFLLYLPFSSSPGRSCGLIDALFTATSAVCVTGLIVKDTPVDFSLFGQLVIMGLIQIGGFGYMTSATIITLLMGKRVGLKDRLIMQESLNVNSLEGIVAFMKGVIKVTLLFELTAAFILTIRFLFDYPLPKALLFGIFHSVSAFNNAGFALFSDNMAGFKGDLVVNLVITTLVIVGGIGFLVISELYKYSRREITRLSVHTRIVLWATAILLAGGTIVLLALEFNNPETLGPLPFHTKALAAWFQSVISRTAGFNTVNIGGMLNASLFALVILMFIGGSPGGTAGGIKTTTGASVILSLYSTFRGRLEVSVFKKRIPQDLIAKSFLLAAMAFLWVALFTFLILAFEGAGNYISVLFEVTSAFGTVGLSVGDGGVLSLSALFGPVGKLLITIVMFIGRLGPLTIGVAVLAREQQRFRYPEANILIG